MTMEPTSQRIALSTGLTYHTLEWGADDPSLDHTVFLIHGFLDFAWTWQETVASGLAGKYHLVAPDLRGHGDSDRVGAGGYYHFMDYLADLQQLVRRLGRARVSMVGHSMGGSVVFYYAGSFPGTLQRVALLEGLGPPESDLSRVPDRISAWLDACERARTRPERRYKTLEEAAERMRATDPLLTLDKARQLAEYGTRLLPDGTRTFKHDPLHLTPGPYPFSVETAMQFFRRISCPVLHVDGAQSNFRLSDEDTTRRKACFGNLREVSLPDAGHMLQRDQPQALAQVLDAFLSEK